MAAAPKTLAGRQAFEYSISSESNWMLPFEEILALV
jgi:hypothetical protein